MTSMFHEGNRQLQDQFDSRRIADRLEDVRMHTAFTPDDRAIIENAAFFFMATADSMGRPDCSYKGGMPGFVRIVDPTTAVFPDYDGNGMFKSLGHILVNPAVGLLFIQIGEDTRRLRVNGEATVRGDDPLMDQFPGARLIVRIKPRHIFPNCPRYIHRFEIAGLSLHAPRPNYTPPEPFWKSKPDLKDFLPGVKAPSRK